MSSFHRVCLPRVSVQSVCPECLSRVSVQSVCPECLSRVSVQSVCPECLSRVSVQSVCPECLSRVSVQSVCPECLSRVFVVVRFHAAASVNLSNALCSGFYFIGDRYWPSSGEGRISAVIKFGNLHEIVIPSRETRDF